MSSRRTSVSLGVVAAVVLALVLSACGAPKSIGAGGAATAAPDYSGTLTVQSEAAITPALMAVVADYKKLHPKFNVSVVNLTPDSARSENILKLSSSGAPDVGFIELSTGVYSTLVQQNQLENLNSIWRANKLADEYPPGSASYMNSGQGTTPYGVMLFAGLGSMVFYNQNLFTRAGVQPPQGRLFSNMNEFYALADKLKAKGIAALSVACNSAVGPGHLIDDLLPTATSRSQYLDYTSNWKKGSTSTLKYTDSPFVKTLQTVMDFVHKGVIEKNCLGVNDTQAFANFANGQTAMLEGSTYYIPQLQGKGKPSFPIGWFMVPPINPGQQTPFWNYTGSMYAVPTHAKNKALALDFLKFLSQPKELSVYAAAGGSIPIVKGATNEQQQFPMLSEVIKLQRTVGSQLIWDSAVPSTLGQKFDAPVLQKMIGGQLSVQETARQFQQQLADLQSGKVKPAGQ